MSVTIVISDGLVTDQEAFFPFMIEDLLRSEVPDNAHSVRATVYLDSMITVEGAALYVQGIRIPVIFAPSSTDHPMGTVSLSFVDVGKS